MDSSPLNTDIVRILLTITLYSASFFKTKWTNKTNTNLFELINIILHQENIIQLSIPTDKLKMEMRGAKEFIGEHKTITQMHHQRRFQGSPTYNELFKLELSGTWEPTNSLRSHWISETERSSDYVTIETWSDQKRMEVPCCQLRFSSKLVVPSNERGLMFLLAWWNKTLHSQLLTDTHRRDYSPT